MLPFDRSLSLIERMTKDLAADARKAGATKTVPSAPKWTVMDLLAHLGMVQRWAAAHVRGDRAVDPNELASAARASAPPDLGERCEWLRSGASDLAATLRAAAPDVRAMRFLKNAPDARTFWARRQTHEATIHRVDAHAARLGHLPTAAQLNLDTDLAVDGLDELLRGFLPRNTSRLRSDEPLTVTVAPTDADRAWTVLISDQPPETSTESDAKADTVFSGSAAQLYLSLWNRADEISETGHSDALGLWRSKVRVRWS